MNNYLSKLCLHFMRTLKIITICKGALFGAHKITMWVPCLERRFKLECNWHLSNELVKIVWLLAMVKMEYVMG